MISWVAQLACRRAKWSFILQLFFSCVFSQLSYFQLHFLIERWFPLFSYRPNYKNKPKISCQRQMFTRHDPWGHEVVLQIWRLLKNITFLSCVTVFVVVCLCFRGGWFLLGGFFWAVYSLPIFRLFWAIVKTQNSLSYEPGGSPIITWCRELGLTEKHWVVWDFPLTIYFIRKKFIF